MSSSLLSKVFHVRVQDYREERSNLRFSTRVNVPIGLDRVDKEAEEVVIVKESVEEEYASIGGLLDVRGHLLLRSAR